MFRKASDVVLDYEVDELFPGEFLACWIDDYFSWFRFGSELEKIEENVERFLDYDAWLLSLLHF